MEDRLSINYFFLKNDTRALRARDKKKRFEKSRWWAGVPKTPPECPTGEKFENRGPKKVIFLGENNGFRVGKRRNEKKMTPTGPLADRYRLLRGGKRRNEKK